MAKDKCCAMCKEKINIDVHNVNWIEYSKKTYHVECFRNYINGKISSGKRVSEWKDKLEKIDDLLAESKEKAERVYYKNKLNDYIINKYQIVRCSSGFWSTVSNLENGIFNKMSCRPISVKTLLQMWVFSERDILKARRINAQKGKTLYGELQIKYDLSIVLNNYDKYISQQASQYAEQMELSCNIRNEYRNKINYQLLSRKDEPVPTDIVSMLEDW